MGVKLGLSINFSFTTNKCTFYFRDFCSLQGLVNKNHKNKKCICWFKNQRLMLRCAVNTTSNWSFKLKEEYKLRELANRVVREMFGANREKVSGGWRKMHYA